MLGEEFPLGDPATMVNRVLRSVTDFGPFTDLLARRDVEEIFVEGPRVTYLDASGRLRGLAEPTSEEENRQMVDRLLASDGTPAEHEAAARAGARPRRQRPAHRGDLADRRPVVGDVAPLHRARGEPRSTWSRATR